jgi:putative endonuclease
LLSWAPGCAKDLAVIFGFLAQKHKYCSAVAFTDENLLMRQRRFYVYMLTSSSRRALYTGLTNNIHKRKEQHRVSDDSTFVGRYNTFRLVYVEAFEDVRNAIDREKVIKGWTRRKKEALIRSVNPQWRDLSVEWGSQYRPQSLSIEGAGKNQRQPQPQGPFDYAQGRLFAQTRRSG